MGSLVMTPVTPAVAQAREDTCMDLSPYENMLGITIGDVRFCSGVTRRDHMIRFFIICFARDIIDPVCSYFLAVSSLHWKGKLAFTEKGESICFLSL